MGNSDEPPADVGAARIHPLTLAITPRSLERSFWAGPTLRGWDQYAADAGFLLLASAWRRASFVSDPERRAALYAGVAAIGAVNVAARACLSLAPGAYGRARLWLVMVMRAMRAASTLLQMASWSPADWDAFQSWQMGPAMRLLRGLGTSAFLGVMQTVQYPVPFPLTAAMQVALAVAWAYSVGGLACTVRTDNQLSCEAAELCGGVQRVRQAVAIAGGFALPAGQRACSRPFEELVTITGALLVVVSVVLTYFGELSLKRRHLALLALPPAEQARPPGSGASACAPGPTPASAVFFGGLAAVLATFAIADWAAAWTPPYKCTVAAAPP